jgi:hypothetical protein
MELGFRILDEKPSTGEVEILPAGWYNAHCISAEVHETKNKTGKVLKATFSILSGFAKSNTVNENYNIFNPNEVAQRIGRSELSAFAFAAGVPNVSDSDILLRKPIKIKLKVEAYQAINNGIAETRFSNRIINYKNINEVIDTNEERIEVEYPKVEVAEQSKQATPVTPTWNQAPAAITPASVTETPAVLGAQRAQQPWNKQPQEQPQEQTASSPSSQNQTPAQETQTPETFNPEQKPAWMTKIGQ